MIWESMCSVFKLFTMCLESVLGISLRGFKLSPTRRFDGDCYDYCNRTRYLKMILTWSGVFVAVTLFALNVASYVEVCGPHSKDHFCSSHQ